MPLHARRSVAKPDAEAELRHQKKGALASSRGFPLTAAGMYCRPIPACFQRGPHEAYPAPPQITPSSALFASRLLCRDPPLLEGTQHFCIPGSGKPLKRLEDRGVPAYPAINRRAAKSMHGASVSGGRANAPNLQRAAVENPPRSPYIYLLEFYGLTAALQRYRPCRGVPRWEPCRGTVRLTAVSVA